MARCSSKTNELRDIDSIGCRARNITILKREIDNFKIKVVTFMINFGRNNMIVIDKCKFVIQLSQDWSIVYIESQRLLIANMYCISFPGDPFV